jgi:threonyl-tRNA synthetase
MNELDHRLLGNSLDLFHQQEEGPGMVFWHPRGWELYRVIEDYLRARMRSAGFQEIRTPQLLARSLWEDIVDLI